MIKQHKRYQSTYKDIKVKSVINLTIIFSFAIATKSHLHSPGARGAGGGGVNPPR